MSEVYAFIEAEKTTHPVALLCRLLKVARSSFYAWLAGEQARAARRAADDALAHEITVLHLASRCTYGVPRIHAGLRRGWTGGSTASGWSGSCASATSPGSPGASAGR
ncbi:hypothetical protein [Streptomyces sp. NBC_00568]|uniref:hypothetical protein n=1 Tax=Streptomyces sp. NBC_00568 TaxID=2975779 RepID=UPI0022577ADE|nr:hypothetical protein [Streptomyces sp. NBC_00568]MCX4993486.1 hypothetical protein [Streptomyces sp. NBC_00568]